MAVLLWLGLSLIGPQANAKSRKPTQAEGTVLKVEIGEKVSTFVISADKESTVLFFNNFGEKKSRTLSRKNYNYILKLVSKTKGLKSQSILQCSRENIVLSTPVNTIEACVSKTASPGKELLDLANVLSLLF